MPFCLVIGMSTIQKAVRVSIGGIWCSSRGNSAPIAYIKVVAVKKLVVEFCQVPPVRPSGEYVARIWPFKGAYLHFIVWCGSLTLL